MSNWVTPNEDKGILQDLSQPFRFNIVKTLKLPFFQIYFRSTFEYRKWYERTCPNYMRGDKEISGKQYEENEKKRGNYDCSSHSVDFDFYISKIITQEKIYQFIREKRNWCLYNLTTQLTEWLAQTQVTKRW